MPNLTLPLQLSMVCVLGKSFGARDLNLIQLSLLNIGDITNR
jgi:uncharacterized protein (DUF697 family)